MEGRLSSLSSVRRTAKSRFGRMRVWTARHCRLDICDLDDPGLGRDLSSPQLPTWPPGLHQGRL